MALFVNGSTHLISAYYSIYRPRKDERLSWPSRLTCSGRFTHISGHPSAAGRTQDRESSPATDRRSTTVPLCHATNCCSTDSKKPQRCWIRLKISTASRLFPIIYNEPENAPPQKKLPLPGGILAPTQYTVPRGPSEPTFQRAPPLVEPFL